MSRRLRGRVAMSQVGLLNDKTPDHPDDSAGQPSQPDASPVRCQLIPPAALRRGPQRELRESIIPGTLADILFSGRLEAMGGAQEIVQYVLPMRKHGLKLAG